MKIIKLYIVMFISCCFAFMLENRYGIVCLDSFDIFEFNYTSIFYHLPLIFLIIKLIIYFINKRNKNNVTPELQDDSFVGIDVLLLVLYEFVCDSIKGTYIIILAFTCMTYIVIPFYIGYILIINDRIEVVKKEHGDAWNGYYTDPSPFPLDKLKKMSKGHETLIYNTRYRLLINICFYMISWLIFYLLLAFK